MSTREELADAYSKDNARCGGDAQRWCRLDFLAGFDTARANSGAPDSMRVAKLERFLRKIGCDCGGEEPDGSSPTCYVCQALAGAAPAKPEGRGRVIQCRGCPTVECTCMTDLEEDLLEKCNELINAAGGGNITQALARLAALSPSSAKAQEEG